MKKKRKLVGKLLHIGKQLLPFVVSGGIVAWLVYSITPEKLYTALSTGYWPWLVVATAVQVVVLFTWDTVCVWWLFSQPDRRLPFAAVLRIRADTVIWSAINLEIGQAVFAWRLAKQFHFPITGTVSRCILLSLVDVSALFSLALAGSFICPSPVTRGWRWIPIGGLAGLLVLLALVHWMPTRWRDWLAAKPWAGWLQWFNWRHGIRLYGLREIMFLLAVTYAGCAFAIGHLPVDAPTVLGTVPFVMIAESLPGTAGMGEREAALLYFYPVPGDQRPVMLSIGLIWSTVVILGRIVISILSWYVIPWGGVARPESSKGVEANTPFEDSGRPTRNLVS